MNCMVVFWRTLWKHSQYRLSIFTINSNNIWKHSKQTVRKASNPYILAFHHSFTNKLEELQSDLRFAKLIPIKKKKNICYNTF